MMFFFPERSSGLLFGLSAGYLWLAVSHFRFRRDVSMVNKQEEEWKNGCRCSFVGEDV
jgi:hypothetical protein